jgi:hypothetical protein
MFNFAKTGLFIVVGGTPNEYGKKREISRSKFI